MRGTLPAGTVAVVISISISACGTGVTAGTQSDTARSWEVSFELSGGIAGTTKQMTISHDGRLVAENLKRRTRVEKRLSPDRLQDLDRMLGGHPPSPPLAATGALSRRCADCIHFRLTATNRDDKRVISESGTVEGRRPGDPDLIGFLIAVLNEAVPP